MKRKGFHRLRESYGDWNIPVVGESHYQNALESICGRQKASANLHYAAHLILEDQNPHDPQAVRVEIQNKTVGYLDRQAAPAYRRWLANEHPGIEVISCSANVRGGWDRGRGDRGHFGVWLDLPPALLGGKTDSEIPTREKSPVTNARRWRKWLIGGAIAIILLCICGTATVLLTGNNGTPTPQADWTGTFSVLATTSAAKLTTSPQPVGTTAPTAQVVSTAQPSATAATYVTLDGYDPASNSRIQAINLWNDYDDRMKGIATVGQDRERVKLIRREGDGVLIERSNGIQGWVTYWFIAEFK